VLVNDVPEESRLQRRQAKPPRKHHYVPVFYQKKFANPDGLLWVYDRQMGTFKELHPDVVCCKRDLYSLKRESGETDTRMETKVLGLVDALGSEGMRQLEAEAGFSAEAAQQVAFFMAFQWTRLPSFSRDISALHVSAIEEVARVAFANVERAQSLMDRHAMETGEAIPVSAQSMVEAIQGKHVKIEATEVPFLTNMAEQAQTLSRVLIGLRWAILVAPADTGFIISDSPVVLVPPRGCDQLGFLVPGTIKYLPLSRGLCLRVSGPGRFLGRRNVDKETVRIVNLNIATGSERFIMGPEKVQLAAIVKRSGTAQEEATPRFIVKAVQLDEDGSLMKIESVPRRYFYLKFESHYAP
jgi:hypothetical protein